MRVDCVFNVSKSNEQRPSYGKTYSYYAEEELGKTLRVGDIVVVDCATGLQLVTVVDVYPLITGRNYSASIVSKTDLGEEIRRNKRIGELRDLLEDMRDELEDEVSYQCLSAYSPKFRALYDEFQYLGGKL